MEEKKTLLTYAGLTKLEDELHDLKVNKRKEVADKIKEAREQGDLSENAEYDAAKDEQRDIEDQPTAFNKEKVIEEIKSWEKASHDAGIQSKYAGLDNKASGYYQESRAYHRAVEIVEKGGE